MRPLKTIMKPTPHHHHRALVFAAPWGTSLILMTLLGVMVLAGTSILLLIILPDTSSDAPGRWVGLIPALVLVATLPFGIRGYRVFPDRLEVLRYGWVTRISLQDLQSAVADPEAMRQSIRTLGNGGLFAFAGWFRSKRLGKYRAFATDPTHSVLLCLSGRKIVVTPDHPRRFIKALDLPREPRHGTR